MTSLVMARVEDEDGDGGNQGDNDDFCGGRCCVDYIDKHDQDKYRQTCLRGHLSIKAICLYYSGHVFVSLRKEMCCRTCLDMPPVYSDHFILFPSGSLSRQGLTTYVDSS